MIFINRHQDISVNPKCKLQNTEVKKRLTPLSAMTSIEI
jgi:hypothetical protein